MKKLVYLSMVLFAGLSVFVSCSQNDPVTPETPENTGNKKYGIPAPASIRISIPENLTKVSFLQDPSNADGEVKLAWEEKDTIYVADHADPSTWCKYAIDTPLDANPHVATFHRVGAEITASRFDVLYGAPSLTLAQGLNLSTQEQTGNAGTDHLMYMALISGVSDVNDVLFTEEWAASKGGSFKQSSILRLRLQMPAAVTSVTSVMLSAPSKLFNTSNKLDAKTDLLTVNFSAPEDITDDDNIVTVYATLPWADVSIPADTELTAVVKTADSFYYSKVFSKSEALALTMGKVNAVKLSRSGFDIFAGGAGVDGDPWQISTKWHMLNINPSLSSSETKYFKILNAINMTGAPWTHINPTSPYKAVDLDGNGKTISYLGANLFYVFVGSVKDLTLDNITASSGAQRGIFAQYINRAGTVVTNVDISNCTISTGGTNCGALVGRINNISSGTAPIITDCDVTKTNVNGSCAGGLFGSVESAISVSNCSYSGGKVTGSSNYTGGFVGHMAAVASSIDQCTVEDAEINGVNYTGGFIGDVAYADPAVAVAINITYNEVKGTTTVNGNSAVGGFAGYIITSGDCSYNSTNAAVTVRNNNGGGFVGTMAGGTLVHNTATGNVTATHEDTGNPNSHGGFVGLDLSGNYSYCKSQGKVVSTGYYVGGFVGQAAGASTYSHCRVQTSLVQSTYNNTSNNPRNNSCVGGFAGVVNGPFTGLFEYCWMSNGSSATDIKSVKQRVGGFIGQIGSNNSTANTGTLHYCRVHRARMSATPTNSGIFVGVCYAAIDQCCATSCYATTILDGSTNVGGFVGYQQYYTISNCYVTGGTISAASGKNANKVGGFAGHAQNTTISNCYTTAAIGSLGTGTQIGSFIGDGNSSNLYIENCLSTHSADFAYNNLYLSTGGHNEVTTSANISTLAQSSDYNWSSTVWNFSNPPALISTNYDPMTF